MSGCIAVLNAGSSSIKFAVFRGADEVPAIRGQVEQIGVAPRLRMTDAQGASLEARSWPREGFDHAAATEAIIEALREKLAGETVDAIGHRVVHGGVRFAAPVRVDASVIAALSELIPLAPLHQPHNLAPIRTIAERAPHIAQVACFDTAFHRTQAPLAQMFALPRRFADAGVRRYGFHGLSYEYVVSRLAEIAPEICDKRLVIAHLGNGASLCAVNAGRSVASTMGFTAVDGLMMGTRCGSLDPGVLIHLMDAYGMDARALEALVYKQSGLLGVSGVSSDMRALRASDEPAAAEAIALFVYRVVREIGSMAAALGGVDALVFTGGIGENDAQARAEIAEGCRWLGLDLDARANASNARRISREASAVSAWVVPTDEEGMMARHTSAVLGLPAAGRRAMQPSA